MAAEQLKVDERGTSQLLPNFHNLRNLDRRGEEWAVVVAQLIEHSLPTPEVRGSNPVIDKLIYRILFTAICQLL